MPCEMNVVAHYLVPAASLIYRKTHIYCKYMGYVNKFVYSDFFVVVTTSVVTTSQSVRILRTKSESVLCLTLVGKRSHLKPFTLRVSKKFCV